MGRGYNRKKNIHSPVPVHPEDTEKLASRMLEAAGYSDEELATIAHDAVETARSALLAMETKIVSYEGEITDRVDMINWKARLQAVRELTEMLGGYQRQQNRALAAVKVEIELKGRDSAVHDRTVVNAQPIDI